MYPSDGHTKTPFFPSRFLHILSDLKFRMCARIHGNMDSRCHPLTLYHLIPFHHGTPAPPFFVVLHQCSGYIPQFALTQLTIASPTHSQRTEKMSTSRLLNRILHITCFVPQSARPSSHKRRHVALPSLTVDHSVRHQGNTSLH